MLQASTVKVVTKPKRTKCEYHEKVPVPYQFEILNEPPGFMWPSIATLIEYGGHVPQIGIQSHNREV